MSRKPKTPKPVDPNAPPKCPFSRNEMIALGKRYLKDPKSFDAKRDLFVLYRLWKSYPSKPFWQVHQLTFGLNFLTWFLGKDGQEHLARDYSVFNLQLPKIEEVKLEAEKVGEDVVIERKPRTMAELLK
jgi:hypothetical protein